MREVTRSGSSTRSFHLVFDEESSSVIETEDFWLDNVIPGRFFLNQEAIDWLKSLKKRQPRK